VRVCVGGCATASTHELSVTMGGKKKKGKKGKKGKKKKAEPEPEPEPSEFDTMDTETLNERIADLKVRRERRSIIASLVLLRARGTAACNVCVCCVVAQL